MAYYILIAEKWLYFGLELIAGNIFLEVTDHRHLLVLTVDQLHVHQFLWSQTLELEQNKC